MAAEHPDELKHDWTCYRGTGHNFLGQPVLHGHGSPGPVIHALNRGALDAYVDSLSPDEKKALYDLFVSGDFDAIREKVDAILEWGATTGRTP